MWETVKAHPYIIGGVGIAGVVLLYALSGGGGATSVAAPSSDPTANGTDVQSQLAASIQTAGINASLQAKQTDDATAITLATLSAQNNFDLAQINAGVSLATINAQSAVLREQNALTAHVQEAQYQVQNNEIAAQTQQNADNLKVISQQIGAQAATSQASISANRGHPIIDAIVKIFPSVLAFFGA